MIVELRVPNQPGPSPGKRTADPPRPKDRALFIPNPKLKLQQQVHEVMRFFHYSPRTEETYWHWIA